MTRRAIQHRRGFTLIETAAAVVILAVAVPPMLWAIREAHTHRVNPVLFSTAHFLAIEKLEDVIADRHSRSGDRGYSYLATINYADEGPGDILGYPQYSRSVSFSEHGPWDNTAEAWSAGAGYMEVTVTVSWQDASQRDPSLSISTVLTEYEAQ